jgi:hypothetical protein
VDRPRCRRDEQVCLIEVEKSKVTPVVVRVAVSFFDGPEGWHLGDKPILLGAMKNAEKRPEDVLHRLRSQQLCRNGFGRCSILLSDSFVASPSRNDLARCV